MRGEDPRRLRPTDPQRGQDSVQKSSRGLIYPRRHENRWTDQSRMGGLEIQEIVYDRF